MYITSVILGMKTTHSSTSAWKEFVSSFSDPPGRFRFVHLKPGEAIDQEIAVAEHFKHL